MERRVGEWQTCVGLDTHKQKLSFFLKDNSSYYSQIIDRKELELKGIKILNE